MHVPFFKAQLCNIYSYSNSGISLVGHWALQLYTQALSNQEVMSRLKGGEGTSDCIVDVLVEVLTVHFLIWKVVLVAVTTKLIHCTV